MVDVALSNIISLGSRATTESIASGYVSLITDDEASMLVASTDDHMRRAVNELATGRLFYNNVPFVFNGLPSFRTVEDHERISEEQERVAKEQERVAKEKAQAEYEARVREEADPHFDITVVSDVDGRVLFEADPQYDPTCEVNIGELEKLTGEHLLDKLDMLDI